MQEALGMIETRGLVAAIEADVEEGVIYKAELFDGLKVFWIEAGAEHAHGHHPFLR